MSDTRYITDLDATPRNQATKQQIHTRTNFISVNRPDSSQLVDLHIYFLPRSAWKDRQNLAYNDAMEEAYSAGFIRVPNHLTLNELRNEIELQCGSDSALPKEYVYLRSVGRALTRVKDKQELELRVKHFRPPQTFAPELFLLEQRHDDYVTTVPATPNTVSSHSRHVKSPNTSTRINEKENNSNSSYNDMAWKKSKDSVQYLNKSIEASMRRQNSNEKEGWTDNDSVKSRDFEKLHEEQERLKRRQNELERLRREVEERQKQLHEEEQRKKKQAEKAQHDRIKMIEARRHKAATIIQTAFRGYYVRKQYLEYQRQKQQELVRKLRERNAINAHDTVTAAAASNKHNKVANTRIDSSLDNTLVDDAGRRSSVIQRSKIFSGSIRDILGPDMDKKTISQLSSDDDDTHSEQTIKTVTTDNFKQLQNGPLGYMSQDNFMFRLDYDNRRNILDESRQPSPAPTLTSFNPKSAQSQLNKPGGRIDTHKSSTPAKTPTSPLFERIKTRDSLNRSIKPERQREPSPIPQQQSRAQTPLAAPRRSATSQEKRNQSSENNRVIINLPSKPTINHFSPPKSDRKTKEVPKIINTYEVMSVQKSKEDIIASISRKSSNTRLDRRTSQSRADSHERPVLSFNQKNSSSFDEPRIVEQHKNNSGRTTEKSVFTDKSNQNSASNRIEVQFFFDSSSNEENFIENTNVDVGEGLKDEIVANDLGIVGNAKEGDVAASNADDDDQRNFNSTEAAKILNDEVDTVSSQSGIIMDESELDGVLSKDKNQRDDELNRAMNSTSIGDVQRAIENVDEYGELINTVVQTPDSIKATENSSEIDIVSENISTNKLDEVTGSRQASTELAHYPSTSQNDSNAEKQNENDVKPRIERTSAGRKGQQADNNTSEIELEYLRKKLEEVTTNRSELETVREELIKRLKQTHNRITLKKKEARDTWKKRYFTEKKKTPPVEEKLQTMLNEIDNLQKKISFNYETEIRAAIQSGRVKESESTTTKYTCFKAQQDIDALKRQLDQAKLRLTTDIKLHNQAETEIKSLRLELTETRAHLNYIKSQCNPESNQID